MKKQFLPMISLILLLLAGCGNRTAETEITEPSLKEAEQSYTFREAVSVLPQQWNPCLQNSLDQDLPGDLLSRGLFAFRFLDQAEGDREAFEDYEMVPEMAADFPVDVTEEIREKMPQFRIPAQGKGYAYRIALNPAAVWENGKPITAETYAESLKRLLDPYLADSRAPEFYSGDFCLSGAEAYSNQGCFGISSLLQLQEQYGSLPAAFDAMGEQPGFLDWGQAFGAAYDFAAFPWEPGDPVMPEGFRMDPGEGLQMSGMTLRELFYFESAAWFGLGCSHEEAENRAMLHSFSEFLYENNIPFSEVGVRAEGENQLLLIFEKPISIPSLCYFLTEGFLVEPELYDASVQKTETGRVYLYGTGKETTLSYGPYKLADYVPGKSMTFRRNESWYGYQDDTHVFEDPKTSLPCRMFQTDVVEILAYQDAKAQKKDFLQGKLSVYGLQPGDYQTDAASASCYRDPLPQTLNLMLNGYLPALQRREADMDRTSLDLETLSLPDFRRAISLSINRESLAVSLDPACRGAYGLLGSAYLCGSTRYRDTDPGRVCLCRVYGVDPERYGNDLQKAAASVTGMDLSGARQAFRDAFSQALEAGFLTDLDGDGCSDQTIPLELAIDRESPARNRMLEQLNQWVSAAARGTPFEGKIHFFLSLPYGDGWDQVFSAGQTDAIIAGWTGSTLHPYGLTQYYSDGFDQYHRNWFPADRIPLTLSLHGEEITLSLRQWSQALNGEFVQDSQGKTRCFGDLQEEEQVRIQILAGLEQRILEEYTQIPLLERAGLYLLSDQLRYVRQTPHPVMGYGGLAYLRYHYSDGDWQDQLNAQKRESGRE